MGWLDCEPEPLFQPTRFEVGDVARVLPRHVLNVLRAVGRQLPPWLIQDVIHPAADYTFTARPMQVRGVPTKP